MSKFFIDDTDLVRVELPEGQWIDHKKELLQGDRDYILNKMVCTKAIVGASKPSTEIELQLGTLPLLERSIVAWSFTVPVNSENINKLRNEYRDLVLQSIDKNNSKSELLKN